MSQPYVLHTYFRSSASWRVRIALGLKGLNWQNAFLHLLQDEHKSAAYLALNPQGLIPTLQVDEGVLTQSVAICEYLDEVHPMPRLLPADPFRRARVRAFVLAIACEIHPLQNSGVLQRLRQLGLPQEDVMGWARDVIDRGFEACASMIAEETGPYCFGEQLTLADVFLVPQMGNARRYGAKFDRPRFLEIEAACMALPAFAGAVPEVQPDAS